MYNGRLAMDFYGHENPITGKDGRIRPGRHKVLTATIGLDLKDIRKIADWHLAQSKPGGRGISRSGDCA